MHNEELLHQVLSRRSNKGRWDELAM